MKYYLVYYDILNKEQLIKYFKNEDSKNKYKNWLLYNKDLYFIIEDPDDINYHIGGINYV